MTDVPCKKNPAHESILPGSHPVVTVLVYAEGYLSEAIYHVRLTDGGLRRLNVYMFPVGEEGADVISIIEAPEVAWTKKLLERYCPAN